MPMETTTRSSGAISGATVLQASTRLIFRSCMSASPVRGVDALAREGKRDRPLAGIGVDEGAAQLRLDVVELVDEPIRDAQRIQDRLHGLGVVVTPPVLLAELAAERHHDDHRQ